MTDSLEKIIADVRNMGGMDASLILILINRINSLRASGEQPAAIGRAYMRWYGTAKGYRNIDVDAAHQAICAAALAQPKPDGLADWPSWLPKK